MVSAKEEFVTAYTSKLEEATGGSVDVDRNGLQLKHWIAELFDFYRDCIPNGCMAFVCPGVSVAQITARLGLVRYSIVIGLYAVLYLLVLLAIIANSAVLNFFCVVAAIAAVIAVSQLRTKMRGLFSIHGSTLKDVASAFLCGPCTIAQMATHADAYEPRTCSFRARSTLEGYVRS